MVDKRHTVDKRNMQGRRRATRSKTPCKTPKNHPTRVHQVDARPAAAAATTKSPEEQIVDKHLKTVDAALDAEIKRLKAAAERLKAAMQADREEFLFCSSCCSFHPLIPSCDDDSCSCH